MCEVGYDHDAGQYFIHVGELELCVIFFEKGSDGVFRADFSWDCVEPRNLLLGEQDTVNILYALTKLNNGQL